MTASNPPPSPERRQPLSRGVRLRLASAILALAVGVTALIIAIVLVHTTLS